MDTTLGNNPEFSSCRCCNESFGNDQLQSLFEYTNDEMEIYKIIMLIAPIAISRNDGFSQKICIDCKSQAMNAYRFRQMCVSIDENVRFNRKPLSITNNEHDYSVWNIMMDDDMDLSEYLIDTNKEEIIQPSLIDETPIEEKPTIDETQNFDAPTSTKKSRRYSCPVCGKLWVTPSKLKRHMVVHRSGKATKQEKSTSEGKKPSFSSPVLFESQKSEPEVQCPICFLAIESQAQLPLHMIVHIKTETRQLSKQNETFAKSFPLAQKLGKRHYNCTVCGSEFQSPAKLTNHMKSQHMRKVSIFKNNNRPVVAEKTQNQSQPKRKHDCLICSKSFQSPYKLNRHIKSHTRTKAKPGRKRVRNNNCPHCGKAFETPSKVLRHLKVHRDILQPISSKSESSPILEISAVTSILGD
ncbi:CLUMA_CG000452, isoform A [Clunio marinus]|uniref:CLUMA_CG000452, isoform A n=1 Tax=Clunio marinus TaxID=568069 RepID=A0A1J1HF70_9DIPT|nr:CLUMA_CG000452, isoform A [Clunio marinus]